jgi:hypothetical protein
MKREICKGMKSMMCLGKESNSPKRTKKMVLEKT